MGPETRAQAPSFDPLAGPSMRRPYPYPRQSTRHQTAGAREVGIDGRPTDGLTKSTGDARGKLVEGYTDSAWQCFVMWGSEAPIGSLSARGAGTYRSEPPFRNARPGDLSGSGLKLRLKA